MNQTGYCTHTKQNTVPLITLMWDVTLIWVIPVAKDLPKILLTENLS